MVYFTYTYTSKSNQPQQNYQWVFIFFIFRTAKSQLPGLYNIVVQYMYITEHKKWIVKKKKIKNTVTIDPIFISTIKEIGKNCSTGTRI